MTISTYHELGGHNIVINNLCKGLNKMGYNVVIGAFNFVQDPPFDIEKINLKKFRSLITTHNDFDIIHNHQTQLNYYSLLTKKPFIFHYHGTMGKIQEINLQMSMLLCRNHISKIISVSHTALENIKNKIPAKIPTEIIYNGIDTSYYHSDLPKSFVKGEPQLLFVGNLLQYKNVGKIISDMTRIIALYPQAHLQIVGDGNDYQQLSIEVKRKGLEKYVELVGKVSSREELRMRYSSCDVYISASMMEACPLPPLEAMACGKPLVLSDIPAHRELIEMSNGGLTFSLLDEFDLQNKIKKVYEKGRVFSSAARKFAEEHDWSIVCNKIAKIYESIMT